MSRAASTVKTATFVLGALHLAACLALDLGRADAWPVFAATKPLIVPLLALWLKLGAEREPDDLPLGRVYAALAACLAGDVALLFPGTPAFMAGMGAFGVAHVLFMSAWLRPLRMSAQFDRDHLVYALPLLVFVYIVYAKVRPALPEALRPAIIAYMLLLVGDCFCAFLRRISVDAPSSASIVNGAFLFVQSDSLIALQEFRRVSADGVSDPGMPYVQFMIMGTYIVGLGLMIGGCIARSRERASG